MPLINIHPPFCPIRKESFSRPNWAITSSDLFVIPQSIGPLLGDEGSEVSVSFVDLKLVVSFVGVHSGEVLSTRQGGVVPRQRLYQIGELNTYPEE